MSKLSHKFDLRSVLHTEVSKKSPLFEESVATVDNEFDDEDDRPTNCRARGTTAPPFPSDPPWPSRRPPPASPAVTWPASHPPPSTTRAPTSELPVPPLAANYLDSPSLAIGPARVTPLPRTFNSGLILAIIVSASCGSGFVVGAAVGAWADAGASGLLRVFLVTTTSAFVVIAFWVWLSSRLQQRITAPEPPWFS